MTAQDVRSVIEEIHAAPPTAALVVAGAGTRALAWLLAEAGASRTVIDAQVPYAMAALDEYVGSRAEQHVSAAEALRMAEAAYWRGLRLSALGRPAEIGRRPVLGVACTAATATDRRRRGSHRAHVAVRGADRQTVSSVVFRKGARDRAGEEEIVSTMLLNALAAACGVRRELPLGLGVDEPLESDERSVNDLLSQVLSGQSVAATVAPDGVQSPGAPTGGVVLAGSFDPLHDGHRRLLSVAEELTGRAGAFEISVTNVEKPPVTRAQLDARLAQFRAAPSAAGATVVVTRAPTYDRKSALIPDTVFVIGYDTAVRLFDDRFYEDYDPARDPEQTGTASGAALAEVRRNGGSFLVAGRLVGGQFRTVDDIPAAAAFSDMLVPVPEDRFRFDVSSTEIRTRR